jgi:uncharacterized membrane protein YdbT with pleckstrin-like domain
LATSKWAFPLHQTNSAAMSYEPTMGTVRRHPALLVAELVVTAPVAGLLWFLLTVGWHAFSPAVPPVVPMILAIAVWLYVAWVRWVSASLTLTDQRVVLTKGVLSQVQRTIPFRRIQYVGLRQSIMGRLVGYGTLEIGVAGYADPHIFNHAPVRQLREGLLIPLA